MLVGDQFKVRFGHRLQTQEAFCVWHYKVEAIVDEGMTASEIADGFGAIWGQWISPLMTTAARFDGTGVQEVRATGLRDEKFSIVGATPGSAGTTPLPMQICGLAKLVTGDAGRAKRGRKYIPFPDKIHSTGNPLEGTSGVYVGLLVPLLTDMMGPVVLTGIGGGATFWPILDRVWVAQPRRITGFQIRQHWGTQRRRSILDNPDAAFPPAL